MYDLLRLLGTNRVTVCSRWFNQMNSPVPSSFLFIFLKVVSFSYFCATDLLKQIFLSFFCSFCSSHRRDCALGT